jgi:hypothetical protein
MHIRGAERLTPTELVAVLDAGGRLVFFEYCISLIFITLRCPTAIYLLRPGEFGTWQTLSCSFLSLMLGWWGVPMGLFYTPLVVWTNLSGGCDVTDTLRPYLLRGIEWDGQVRPEPPRKQD